MMKNAPWQPACERRKIAAKLVRFDRIEKPCGQIASGMRPARPTRLAGLPLQTGALLAERTLPLYGGNAEAVADID